MTEPQGVMADALDYSMGPERRRRLAADILVKLTRAGYALVRTPETLDAPYWCGGPQTGQPQPHLACNCTPRAATPSPTPPEGRVPALAASMAATAFSGAEDYLDTDPASPTPPEGLRTPYGGHPEFGPRVVANQAQPSIAGWESLAKDALLAFDQARAALAASLAPDPGAGLREAAQEVIAADGAVARQEAGADRRWDEALAALDAALAPDPGADVDYDEMRLARGWPTPNHMRTTADALDTLTPARYGDVLRWFADLCDAALAPSAEPPETT